MASHHCRSAGTEISSAPLSKHKRYGLAKTDGSAGGAPLDVSLENPAVARQYMKLLGVIKYHCATINELFPTGAPRGGAKRA